MRFFSSEARKAQAAAVIAFLGPILTYVISTQDWSWRFFIGSVLAGIIAGAAVYETPNDPPTPPVVP